MVSRYFAASKVIDFNQYTNVSFDIMFATNCATDGAGSYGDVIVACVPNRWLAIDLPRDLCLGGSQWQRLDSCEYSH